MTRLDPATYLAHLVEESRRFRDTLADCDPMAPVPACPEWTADDLLWHLTEVQGFWGHVIVHRPADPDDYKEPIRPSDHAALLTAFDLASKALTDALNQAAPDEAAWSWDDEQTVGFTLRRQAHEVLVHRVDAEQTAGLPSSIDPGLATDGVDEVLTIFYGGSPPWATCSLTPYVVDITMTDSNESLLIKPGVFSGTGPESGKVYDGEGMLEVLSKPAASDAAISGTAEDLLLWLWKRADDRRISMSGDSAAIAAFSAGVSSPID